MKESDANKPVINDNDMALGLTHEDSMRQLLSSIFCQTSATLTKHVPIKHKKVNQCGRNPTGPWYSTP